MIGHTVTLGAVDTVSNLWRIYIPIHIVVVVTLARTPDASKLAGNGLG